MSGNIAFYKKTHVSLLAIEIFPSSAFFCLIGHQSVKVGVEKILLSMIVFLWLLFLVKAKKSRQHIN
jgi:hypothetical protein